MRAITTIAVLSTTGSTHLNLGLLITAFVFGLRHGVDWDHLAAISDITSSQSTPRRSLTLATLYAGGHGLVVLALGSLAVGAGILLPKGIDGVMERVVGVTLILLGVYVFYTLARYGTRVRMRSRWMLIIVAVRRAIQWFGSTFNRSESEEIKHEHEHGPLHGHDDPTEPTVVEPARSRNLLVTQLKHRHTHKHVGTLPDDPFTNYGIVSSFLIGMLHGVGAETATQLVIFLTAAKAGGTAAGLAIIATFTLGLLTSNSAFALVSTFGFRKAGNSSLVYTSLAVVTAAISLVVGALFVAGMGSSLPVLLGG